MEDSQQSAAEKSPGHSNAAAAATDVPAEGSEKSEGDFLARQLATLNVDSPQQRVLIRLDGDPVARLKDLRNVKVSRKPRKIEKLWDGDYTSTSQESDGPMIKLESNFTDTWVRSVVFKAEGLGKGGWASS